MNQHDMRGLHQSPSPVSPVLVASLHPQPWTTNSDLLCGRCVETCGSLRLLRVHGPAHQLNPCSDPNFTMRALHVQWHHSLPDTTVQTTNTMFQKLPAQAWTDLNANLRLHICAHDQGSRFLRTARYMVKTKAPKSTNRPLNFLAPHLRSRPPSETLHVHFRPMKHQTRR